MHQPHSESIFPNKDGSFDTHSVPLAEASSYKPATIVGVLERVADCVDRLTAVLAVSCNGNADHTVSARNADPIPVAWSSIATNIARIADRLDPPANEIIDSPTLARRLGCTTTWVAEMARAGQIPKSCIVPGTGNGKPWKFCRAKIDAWLASR